MIGIEKRRKGKVKKKKFTREECRESFGVCMDKQKKKEKRMDIVLREEKGSEGTREKA